ncbi:MAG: MotA/TolQ/ExbB proton channel family protein [candidate division Zixibacteria bacterium]|nr:MotA/TolQ/ExbB proton channel family protein [candidate division Zixibacteria bacterium]
MNTSIWQIINDTSTFGLFILIILVIMSLISWTVIFNKWREFSGIFNDTEKFLQQFRRSRSLNDIVGAAKTTNHSPLSSIFLAGFGELNELRSMNTQAPGLQQNRIQLSGHDFEIIEMTMERISTDETVKMERSVVFLATTASAAPFMGLLGTVVGIMDAFWSIGERGSASLAIVAPGIAEALLATIVGLGAAIPAVIAYNWANNKMKGINDRSFSFILEFIARARKEER